MNSYNPIITKNTPQVKDYSSKIVSFSDVNSLIPDCLNEMSSNGIPFNGPLQIDGNIHRFSIDNKSSQPDEWYVAHAGVNQKGNSYLICIYGSWSTGERYEYRSWQLGGGEVFSKEDLEQIKREIDHAKGKAAEERLQKQNEAALQSKFIWKESSNKPPTPDHKKYLEKKQIKPLGDVCFDYYNNDMKKPCMILPMYSIDQQLKSLQFMWVDEAGITHKRFLAGGQKKGCFMALKPIDQSNNIYVCEGYATGVSIQETLSDAVIVAFDAGNIEAVIEVLKKRYPHKKITIAADNDKTGLQKAKSASSKYGCCIVYPDFSQFDHSHEMTDFNDLMVIAGKDILLSQLLPQPIKDLDLTSILDNLDKDPCKDLSMEHFPAVLTTYIKGLSEMTQAHPIMIIMSVLCSISSMVGKKIYMPRGQYFQNMYPNIWSLCITKSGGFKTTALNKGSEIALEKDRKILQMMEDIKNRENSNFNLFEDDSKFSDGIRNELKKKSLKRPMLPTRTSTEFLIKHLAEGHQGMILSSELGEWLGNMQKKHNLDLKQIFTYFYDVDIAPYEHRTKHCGNYIVKTPFVTINGVSTVDWIESQVKADDVFSGFFARVLLFSPPFGDIIPDARPKKLEMSLEAMKAKEKIAANLEHIGELCFSFSSEAGKEFDTIHQALYQMVRSSKYDERCRKFLEPYLKRWSPYIIKLAMLFRIIEDPLSEELSVSSIKAAMEVIKVAIKSTAKLFERELGESEDQRKQRRVFEWVVRKRGKGKTAHFYALLQSKTLDCGSKEYEEVVQTLIDSKKIYYLNQAEDKKNWELELCAS